MLVHLAYGQTGLPVEFPDDRTVVVAPRHRPAAADPVGLLRRTLREHTYGPPLRDLVPRGATVAISMCDGTRPQPRHLMIPALLDELDGLVRPEDVVVLVATGTHRGNTEAELRGMLGDEVYDAVRVVNHDARDPSTLRWCGTHGDGVPVWLNREWLDADVRITTGFVEPHFFAGFSGGPKLVAPGLAGLDTTLVLHDARRIGHPNATWGVTVGNPVHDDVRAIAAATGVTYTLDVVLDREQRIVAAFGGGLEATHRAATALVRDTSMVAVDRPFEVVVTTNSGYPLDQNLYQAVKGMSAAASVVVDGGVIVCAAECRDGFPDHGGYRDVLRRASSPAELLRQIESRERTVPDQWQVQVQAKVQSRARVAVRSDHLDAAALAEAHFDSVDDVGEFVCEQLAAAGPDARCCVLPEGPQTVPYLRAHRAGQATDAAG
jgi:lactate racemase